MKIEMPEVINGLESENVGRLTAMWTVVAFERAQGDVNIAKSLADELGCSYGVGCVIRHVAKLPANERGYVTE